MTMYWRIGKSRVVHKDEVKLQCHYWTRSKEDLECYDKKPRNCSVCDSCQLIEKKARAAARRKVK
jgi:7-cyano-7-deazaguanine synthase in queuosine biosynthesis